MSAYLRKMANMKIIKMAVASLALGVFLLGGCGKNKAVQFTEDLANEVCACKDVQCAQDVVKKGADKMMEFKDEKGTESDLKAIQAASEKMQECMKKMTAK
jgi:hypothetical protein